MAASSRCVALLTGSLLVVPVFDAVGQSNDGLVDMGRRLGFEEGTEAARCAGLLSAIVRARFRSERQRAELEERLLALRARLAAQTPLSKPGVIAAAVDRYGTKYLAPAVAWVELGSPVLPLLAPPDVRDFISAMVFCGAWGRHPGPFDQVDTGVATPIPWFFDLPLP